MSNFLEKLFNTSEKPLPINKIMVITTFDTYPIIKEKKDFDYLSSLSEEDQYYNYKSEFYILNYENITYENNEFTNCGENTIFNLLNYLLTHYFVDGEFEFNQKLNIEKLRKLDGTDTTLYNFYKEYTDYDDLMNQYQSKQEIKNKFASNFYRLTKEPHIYNIRNICEIRPSEENIIKLMNIIFETIFNNIKEFIKYFDSHHNIEYKNDTTILLDKKYKLSLTDGHASIENASMEHASMENVSIREKQLYKLVCDPYEKGLTYRNKLLLYGKISYNGEKFMHLLINSYIDEKEKIKIIKSIYKKYLNIVNDNNSTLLHKTVMSNLLNIMKILLEEGVDDINAKDNAGYTPLHLAIVHDNYDILQILIENGANINEKYFNDTPILLAIKKNKPNIIKLLIEKGANLNEKDDFGNTPLHFAYINELFDRVILLIEQGADIYIQNRDGSTIIDLIMEKEIDINNSYEISDDNEDKNIKIIDKLLEKGVNIDIHKKMNNLTLLLYIAIIDNLLNLTKLLIEKGVDINSLKYRDSFLNLAIINKSSGIAKLLIEKGANINIQNYNNKTPLELAIDNDLIDIVKILIKKISEETNNPELHIAIRYESTKIVNLLINEGVDINKPDNSGNTPLQSAIKNKLSEIAEILIEKGADINTPDNSGNTPLHLAIKYRLTNIAKILINRKVNINAINNNNYTPLDLAIRKNLLEIEDLLIAKDAKINIDELEDDSTNSDNQDSDYEPYDEYYGGAQIQITKSNNTDKYKLKYLKYKEKYLKLKKKFI